MKDSKKDLSQITKRAPFDPINRPEQMLVALYEILDLATRGKVTEIVPLVQSVIDVAQANPGKLAKCGIEPGGAQ